MKRIVELKKENYESEVLKSKRPVLVYFHANWCRFCSRMDPVFEEIFNELAPKIKFCKVDIDKEKWIAEHNNIKGVPCIILFKSGMEIGRILGVENKEMLAERIKSHLADIG